MALIEWEDSYNLGIEHLDNQHKGLVKQINILHAAMKIGKGKESLDEILKALINYTATHFKSEEELFFQYNFPDSKKHIAEHEKFVKEVLKFKEDFDKGRLMVSIDVLHFLKGWLINHILGSDMGYKSFLLSKGVR
ncbi:MAG: bacteriohemerythrin [Bacteroidetes bacterium]|nr:bacteriohemerythrin [Bacteroidota bacterium]